MLGICGSPIRRGNTELFLREALNAVGKDPEVKMEIISLAKKKIGGCMHCNFCVTRQSEGKFCSQKDDMTEIYPRVVEADLHLWASPVYIGRLSGHLANFIDRLRAVSGVAKYYRSALKDKPGCALAVVWLRDCGAEPTLMSITWSFFHLGMIPVGAFMNGPFGAVGHSSLGGLGAPDKADRQLVLKDEHGLRAARFLIRRGVDLAKKLKAGSEALKS